MVRRMASNSEVNAVIESEKEEGELFRDDVSSSEDAQVHKYISRINGKCRYCLSKSHCAPWCSNVEANLNKQGKSVCGI